MNYSNLNEERKLWREGYRFIAGIDEVGRGPLAGPVVAAAVCLDSKLGLARFNLAKPSFRLRDSKKLSAKQREELYPILTAHPAIRWGIGKVYPKMIDRINIFQATKLAMQKAIENLQRKLKKNQSTKTHDRSFLDFIDFLIVDGNMKLKTEIPQKSIVKGDEKVFSCSAASIIAKVTRDNIMDRYHKKYPQYGFNKHKGYGTSLHLKRLWRYGPCKIHRRSFAPVSRI